MQRRADAAPASDQAGFGLKERAWNDRALLGLWRERWAEMANARLAELGYDVLIDHRSNAARGLDLEPQNKIGPAAARRARKGEAGERTQAHRAIARRNGERLLAQPELALQALTQQQSTFTRPDLARLVHRQSDGAAQFTAVMAKLEASPELVRVGQDGRGRDRFSTMEMVQVEHRLAAVASALNNRATHRVAEVLRLAPVDGGQLGEEQRLALLHVTRSRDLAVVVGIACGGKSTMLGAARAAWQAQGYRVRGAALSGIAAEGLEGSAGIESRTIASWAYAWQQGKELLTARDVLVLDEAGMVGSRQLDGLLRRVHRAGAKIVMVGDAEQLQAIEAGAAFRAVAERVGAAAITEPRRQLMTWMREATKELASARTGDALSRYAGSGFVHRHATREVAGPAVIAGWDAARRQSPHQSHIIFAHERVDVRILNEGARTVRRTAGELGPDHLLQTELGMRAFAEGDRVYFLRNERGLGVKNGTLGTVETIKGSGGDARLSVRLDAPGGARQGRVVAFSLADYADLDHGYAATIHKNQGATVDQAHVLATPGMDRHLTYVALSRHRHAVHLHWGEDDFGARLHAVLGRERAKDTTLDYDETGLKPVAAYARQRGLAPQMPTSEIVVRPARAAAGGDTAKDEYDPASIAILDGIEPPPGRQRPRDHITADQPAIDPPPPAIVETPTPTPVAARPARPKPAVRKRAARRPTSTPAALVPAPLPRWPWTDLDGTPPASPLLRAAVRYDPVSAVQMHETMSYAVAEERRRFDQRHQQVYRNPEEASARFTLLKAELGIDAARDRVVRDPSILGSLRGGWLTAAGRHERAQALRSGQGIVDDERTLRQAEQEAWLYQRAADERRREQATIEIPALSAKAQAAIRALAEAGAKPGWAPHELSKHVGPTPETVLEIAKASLLYEAIRADEPLMAELTQFEARVASRFANPSLANPAPGFYRNLDAERTAKWLHGVLVAARACHAWHPVLQEYVVAHPKLKIRVEHAEQGRLEAARQASQAAGHDPQPRPSPKPSFGPGP